MSDSFLKKKAVAWCFTINNPHINEIDSPRAWQTADTIRGAVWQYERGQSGTPHIQGYLQLHRTQRGSWVKKRLHSGAHWEPARADYSCNEEYCTKEEGRIAGPWTVGRFKRAGERSDIQAVQKAIEDGQSERQIAAVYPEVWFKYPRAVKEYRRLIVEPRRFKSRVIVLVGPTGTGKTSFAFHCFDDVYVKPHGEWFDGYDGESVVLIDEFYGWIPYSLLLTLLDRYPCLVPFKGGFHQWSPRTIVLTSNKPPNEWYSSEKHPYAPLERRIDVLAYKDELDQPFNVVKGCLYPNYDLI
jgi:hypothetical protein